MLTITSRLDYAVRAALELAEAGGTPLQATTLAQRQQLPLAFLRLILTKMRHAGLIRYEQHRRGYRLARPAGEITIADIITAVEGYDLVDIPGDPAEETQYNGAASRLPEVWVALRASLGAFAGSVSLADLVQPVGSLGPNTLGESQRGRHASG